MSEFSDSMLDAHGALAEEFGQVVTYTPPGGDGVEITAHCGPIHGDGYSDENNKMALQFRDIKIALADVSSPVINAVITVGSESWKVTDPPDVLSGVAILHCRKDETIIKRHETSRKELPSR